MNYRNLKDFTIVKDLPELTSNIFDPISELTSKMNNTINEQCKAMLEMEGIDYNDLNLDNVNEFVQMLNEKGYTMVSKSTEDNPSFIIYELRHNERLKYWFGVLTKFDLDEYKVTTKISDIIKVLPTI